MIEYTEVFPQGCPDVQEWEGIDALQDILDVAGELD